MVILQPPGQLTTTQAIDMVGNLHFPRTWPGVDARQYRDMPSPEDRVVPFLEMNIELAKFRATERERILNPRRPVGSLRGGRRSKESTVKRRDEEIDLLVESRVTARVNNWADWMLIDPDADYAKYRLLHEQGLQWTDMRGSLQMMLAYHGLQSGYVNDGGFEIPIVSMDWLADRGKNGVLMLDTGQYWRSGAKQGPIFIKSADILPIINDPSESEEEAATIDQVVKNRPAGELSVAETVLEEVLLPTGKTEEVDLSPVELRLADRKRFNAWFGKIVSGERDLYNEGYWEVAQELFPHLTEKAFLADLPKITKTGIHESWSRPGPLPDPIRMNMDEAKARLVKKYESGI